MQRTDHPLLSPSLGSHKTLTSFHFGTPGHGPKVYIQASLHAEELPGMLVAHHLRALLEAADAAGQIQGEVILVPVANPIGLAQRVDHKAMGRFELDSSENFNRHYPDLAKAVWPAVQDKLGADPHQNVAAVRRAMGPYLQAWVPDTELQSLRRTLLLLAYDADSMLDLHCDCESVMHFYTEDACWPQLEPLTHFLQCQAILLARNSGSGPIDECLSGAWWRLADLLATHGNPARRAAAAPPLNCAARPTSATHSPRPTRRLFTSGCSTRRSSPVRRQRSCRRPCASPRRWRAPRHCVHPFRVWWCLPPRSASACRPATWWPRS
jgi:predicted deacylase